MIITRYIMHVYSSSKTNGMTFGELISNPVHEDSTTNNPSYVSITNENLASTTEVDVGDYIDVLESNSSDDSGDNHLYEEVC